MEWLAFGTEVVVRAHTVMAGGGIVLCVVEVQGTGCFIGSFRPRVGGFVSL